MKENYEEIIAEWFRLRFPHCHDYVRPGDGKGYDQYGNILKCWCGSDAVHVGGIANLCENCWNKNDLSRSLKH